MSVLSGHLKEGIHTLPNGFHRVRPQVIRVVLQTLKRALAETVSTVGRTRLHEPRFTRQLLLDFERARDDTPSTPRYDITHQPELPIPDTSGAVASHRRLDFRLVFLRQVGRTGDYLCLECKYLDTSDRDTDRAYVNEGVDRIVIGDYARNHPWAIMVGLERVGPICMSIQNVDARLVAKYGKNHGFKPKPSVKLSNVRESDHYQTGGLNKITIVHAFFLIG